MEIHGHHHNQLQYLTAKTFVQHYRYTRATMRIMSCGFFKRTDLEKGK